MSAASPEGTLTVDHPPSQSSTTAASQPSWFVSCVWLLLVAELAWAVAGVVAGMAGVFMLATVLPLWLVLTAALWVATRPLRAKVAGSRAPAADAIPANAAARTTEDAATAATAPRSTRWIRAAALLVVVGSIVLNGAFPGEHLQTGRDGGTYTATAGWLATDGGLRIHAIVPPFDDPTGLRYEAAGFHEIVDGGPLYAQFMHAFPAMLATAELAGGIDLMVRTNALLGGLALLAFYAFAERLVRPWAALLAQVSLAVNLVFIYFTRAPFSELLTMGMLFAGLWALDQAAAHRDRRGAFVAGLFIGGTFLARLDGLVVLLTVLAALLPPLVRGRVGRVAPDALAGIAVTSAIAAVDLFVFSPFYVQLHVSFLVPLGLGFLALAGIAALATTAPGRRMVRTVVRHRRGIATALAAVIVTAGVLAYAVRPSFAVSTWDRTTPIGFLQQAEGEVVNEARTYAEQSARWLGWYLGVPALAVALLGWAAMVRRTVAHRLDRLAPFVLTLSGLTVLYLWMPSITPDHIWADRRFLPVVYPGLILCAAWLIDRALRSPAAQRWRVPATVAAALAAVALVAGPLVRSLPVLNLHEQAGMARDVAEACEQLGDDAALLLLDEEDSFMHYRMTQPLRAHCGVPAAWTTARISDEQLLELAERAEDRTLYVLAEHRETFEGRPVGDVRTLLRHRGVRLAQTLTIPPQELTGYGLDVLAAPVTAGAATPEG